MKKNENWLFPTILVIVGGLIFYFREIIASQISSCSGWNFINPFCWFGVLTVQAILFWGSIILVVASFYKLVRVALK